MTCSPSFLRIRPWSTNTHVSWSPIARCTSRAATDESTPPESPQITRPVPTCARILSICSSMIEAGRPRARAAADLLEERGQHLLPVGRVDDLGVELDPVQAALDVLQRGDRRLRRARQRGEARRRLVDRVAVRHPARLLRRRAGQQPPGLGDRQLRAPELPHLGALDLAAELQHQRLHAVTDAQHRDPELEQLRLQPRRALGVHRGGPAGEDQPLRPAPPHLLDADVVRQQLREHAALAHAARDQLRVLPAVVEHDDLVGRHLALERKLLQGLVGRDGRPVPLGAELSLRQAPLRRRARPCRPAGRAAAACPPSAAPARSSARPG